MQSAACIVSQNQELKFFPYPVLKRAKVGNKLSPGTRKVHWQLPPPVNFIISFGYAHMNKVMRIIKEKNLQIISQKMEMDCEIEISIRKKNVQNLLDTFESLYEIKLTEI